MNPITDQTPDWCVAAASAYLAHLDRAMESAIPRHLLQHVRGKVPPQKSILAGVIARFAATSGNLSPQINTLFGDPVREEAAKKMAANFEAIANGEVQVEQPQEDDFAKLTELRGRIVDAVTEKAIRITPLAESLKTTEDEIRSTVIASAGTLTIVRGWVKLA